MSTYTPTPNPDVELRNALLARATQLLEIAYANDPRRLAIELAAMRTRASKDVQLFIDECERLAKGAAQRQDAAPSTGFSVRYPSPAAPAADAPSHRDAWKQGLK